MSTVCFTDCVPCITSKHYVGNVVTKVDFSAVFSEGEHLRGGLYQMFVKSMFEGSKVQSGNNKEVLLDAVTSRLISNTYPGWSGIISANRLISKVENEEGIINFLIAVCQSMICFNDAYGKVSITGSLVAELNRQVVIYRSDEITEFPGYTIMPIFSSFMGMTGVYCEAIGIPDHECVLDHCVFMTDGVDVDLYMTDEFEKLRHTKQWKPIEYDKIDDDLVSEDLVVESVLDEYRDYHLRFVGQWSLFVRGKKNTLLTVASELFSKEVGDIVSGTIMTSPERFIREKLNLSMADTICGQFTVTKEKFILADLDLCSSLAGMLRRLSPENWGYYLVLHSWLEHVFIRVRDFEYKEMLREFMKKQLLVGCRVLSPIEQTELLRGFDSQMMSIIGGFRDSQITGIGLLPLLASTVVEDKSKLMETLYCLYNVTMLNRSGLRYSGALNESLVDLWTEYLEDNDLSKLTIPTFVSFSCCALPLLCRPGVDEVMSPGLSWYNSMNNSGFGYGYVRLLRGEDRFAELYSNGFRTFETVYNATRLIDRSKWYNYYTDSKSLEPYQLVRQTVGVDVKKGKAGYGYKYISFDKFVDRIRIGTVASMAIDYTLLADKLETDLRVKHFDPDKLLADAYCCLQLIKHEYRYDMFQIIKYHPFIDRLVIAVLASMPQCQLVDQVKFMRTGPSTLHIMSVESDTGHLISAGAFIRGIVSGEIICRTLPFVDGICSWCDCAERDHHIIFCHMGIHAISACNEHGICGNCTCLPTPEPSLELFVGGGPEILHHEYNVDTEIVGVSLLIEAKSGEELSGVYTGRLLIADLISGRAKLNPNHVEVQIREDSYCVFLSDTGDGLTTLRFVTRLFMRLIPDVVNISYSTCEAIVRAL